MTEENQNTGKKAIHAESGDEFVEVDNGKI